MDPCLCVVHLRSGVRSGTIYARASQHFWALRKGAAAGMGILSPYHRPSRPGIHHLAGTAVCEVAFAGRVGAEETVQPAFLGHCTVCAIARQRPCQDHCRRDGAWPHQWQWHAVPGGKRVACG